MMQVAAIGDDEFITGLMLAGITRTYNVDEGLEKAFEDALKDKGVGIVITHDIHYEKLPPRIRSRCDQSNDPVFVVVGRTNDGSLREQIIRTVGVDLWKE